VFTARYGLSPYIPQKRFVFKRLNITCSMEETALRNFELNWLPFGV